ncbi:hypothetical protein D046_2636B, partial [Vibrio parahaemolyticus V-223/04]
QTKRSYFGMTSRYFSSLHSHYLGGKTCPAVGLWSR